ncbi:MAG: flotillin family protein [Clostridiales bacterium]|jgi:flotillin|nr:flotillin family protein [Clostridiales bacterium]
MANFTVNLIAASGSVGGIIGIIIGVTVLTFALLVSILSRFKKCPPDKIMLIYGKIGANKDGTARSAKCVHGGASFVWPYFQSYSFLDLTPMGVSVDLKNTLSKQNIRIDVPSRFTVGISTEHGVMQNAAERLRGLRPNEVQDLAKEIVLGQLRLVVALMDIEEINSDRDKFLEAVSRNVEGELKKIGLRLINVNVTDISDESGYIDALGKEAAAKAINDARRSVAEKTRDGSIGEALAVRDQRVEVANANSTAVEGENASQARISQSNAKRRQIEAEAEKEASIAEQIAEANANKAGYIAEQQAELARAEREKSTLEADVIVKAEIEKRRLELQAEAEAEVVRRKARGDADAVKMQKIAEAEGIFAVLEKQAQGFQKIIQASGGSNEAVKLMMTDKLEDLIRVQVEAIKNIKIDKVTVWDSLGAAGKDGTGTANFISGMLKSVPPLNDMYKMVGMQLPEYLGKVDDAPVPAAVTPEKVKPAQSDEAKTGQKDKPKK